VSGVGAGATVDVVLTYVGQAEVQTARLASKTLMNADILQRWHM